MIYKLDNGGVIKLQPGSTIPEDEQFDSIRPAHKIDLSKARRKEIRNFARNLAGMDNPEYGATAKDYQEGFVNLGLNKRKSKFFDRVFRNQLAKNLEHTDRVNRDQQVIQAAKEGNFDPEQFGQWIATKRDESPITQKFVAPLVIGTAFGPAMAVASLAGEATNLGTNAITGWDTWGEALASGRKGWSWAAEVTNPGYIATGSLATIEPIVNSIKPIVVARNIRVKHPELIKQISFNGDHAQSLITAWNNNTGQFIRYNPKFVENARKVNSALLYGKDPTLESAASLSGFKNKTLSRLGINKNIIDTIYGTNQASKKLLAAKNLPENVTLYSGAGPKKLKYLGHGQEHEVYIDGDKVIKFKFHRNPESYLPHNSNYSTLTDEFTSTGAYRYKKQGADFIPERKYLGVGIDDGGSLIPVFEEDFIKGVTPTQLELNEAFAKNGIKYDGVKQVTFKDGSIAQDINPKNVKLVDGKPIIIDPITGGAYNPNSRYYKFKPRNIVYGSRPISEAERLGIPKGKRNSKIKESVLNWSWQDWFKDRINGAGHIKPSDFDKQSLYRHIPEYRQIEVATKRDGTWLKMPDGSIFEGDPREWVMAQSKAAQGLNFNDYYKLGSGQKPGYTVYFESQRNAPTMIDEIKGNFEGTPGRPAWLTNFEHAKRFANDGRGIGYTYKIYPQRDVIKANFDLQGLDWDRIPVDIVKKLNIPVSNGFISTNRIVSESPAQIIHLNNVAEGSGGIQNLVDDVIIKGKRKSILGNNGNFDWNNEVIWRKWGGIIKAQHGILTPWYNLYNSNVGKRVRDFMLGKDHNLPDEEYVQKYGYAKPITGTGMLPGKTSMNVFEGIEGPLVKGSFGTGAKYNSGLQAMKTKVASKLVKPKTVSNWDKFLKKSLDEQNKIVKYWDERYSTIRQLQANQKQFKRFVNWINKQ